MTIKNARKMALAFDDVVEMPHFEKTSFRVNKKIFLTLDEKNHRGSVPLSAIDQDVFSGMSQGAIYPVPNKWGKQGWTFIDLQKVEKRIFKDVLLSAYGRVSGKK